MKVMTLWPDGKVIHEKTKEIMQTLVNKNATNQSDFY